MFSKHILSTSLLLLTHKNCLVALSGVELLYTYLNNSLPVTQNALTVFARSKSVKLTNSLQAPNDIHQIKPNLDIDGGLKILISSTAPLNTESEEDEEDDNDVSSFASDDNIELGTGIKQKNVLTQKDLKKNNFDSPNKVNLRQKSLNSSHKGKSSFSSAPNNFLNANSSSSSAVAIMLEFIAILSSTKSFLQAMHHHPLPTINVLSNDQKLRHSSSPDSTTGLSYLSNVGRLIGLACDCLNLIVKHKGLVVLKSSSSDQMDNDFNTMSLEAILPLKKKKHVYNDTNNYDNINSLSVGTQNLITARKTVFNGDNHQFSHSKLTSPASSTGGLKGAINFIDPIYMSRNATVDNYQDLKNKDGNNQFETHITTESILNPQNNRKSLRLLQLTNLVPTPLSFIYSDLQYKSIQNSGKFNEVAAQICDFSLCSLFFAIVDNNINMKVGSINEATANISNSLSSKTVKSGGILPSAKIPASAVLNSILNFKQHGLKSKILSDIIMKWIRLSNFNPKFMSSINQILVEHKDLSFPPLLDKKNRLSSIQSNEWDSTGCNRGFVAEQCISGHQHLSENINLNRSLLTYSDQIEWAGVNGSLIVELFTECNNALLKSKRTCIFNEADKSKVLSILASIQFIIPSSNHLDAIGLEELLGTLASTLSSSPTQLSLHSSKSSSSNFNCFIDCEDLWIAVGALVEALVTSFLKPLTSAINQANFQTMSHAVATEYLSSVFSFADLFAYRSVCEISLFENQFKDVIHRSPSPTASSPSQFDSSSYHLNFFLKSILENSSSAILYELLAKLPSCSMQVPFLPNTSLSTLSSRLSSSPSLLHHSATCCLEAACRFGRLVTVCLRCIPDVDTLRTIFVDPKEDAAALPSTRSQIHAPTCIFDFNSSSLVSMIPDSLIANMTKFLGIQSLEWLLPVICFPYLNFGETTTEDNFQNQSTSARLHLSHNDVLRGFDALASLQLRGLLNLSSLISLSVADSCIRLPADAFPLILESSCRLISAFFSPPIHYLIPSYMINGASLNMSFLSYNELPSIFSTTASLLISMIPVKSPPSYFASPSLTSILSLSTSTFSATDSHSLLIAMAGLQILTAPYILLPPLTAFPPNPILPLTTKSTDQLNSSCFGVSHDISAAAISRILLGLLLMQASMLSPLAASAASIAASLTAIHRQAHFRILTSPHSSSKEPLQSFNFSSWPSPDTMEQRQNDMPESHISHSVGDSFLSPIRAKSKKTSEFTSQSFTSSFSSQGLMFHIIPGISRVLKELPPPMKGASNILLPSSGIICLEPNKNNDSLLYDRDNNIISEISKTLHVSQSSIENFPSLLCVKIDASSSSTPSNIRDLFFHAMHNLLFTCLHDQGSLSSLNVRPLLNSDNPKTSDAANQRPFVIHPLLILFPSLHPCLSAFITESTSSLLSPSLGKSLLARDILIPLIPYAFPITPVAPLSTRLLFVLLCLRKSSNTSTMKSISKASVSALSSLLLLNPPERFIRPFIKLFKDGLFLQFDKNDNLSQIEKNKSMSEFNDNHSKFSVVQKLLFNEESRSQFFDEVPRNHDSLKSDEALTFSPQLRGKSQLSDKYIPKMLLLMSKSLGMGQPSSLMSSVACWNGLGVMDVDSNHFNNLVTKFSLDNDDEIVFSPIHNLAISELNFVLKRLTVTVRAIRNLCSSTSSKVLEDILVSASSDLIEPFERQFRNKKFFKASRNEAFAAAKHALLPSLDTQQLLLSQIPSFNFSSLQSSLQLEHDQKVKIHRLHSSPVHITRRASSLTSSISLDRAVEPKKEKSTQMCTWLSNLNFLSSTLCLLQALITSIRWDVHENCGIQRSEKKISSDEGLGVLKLLRHFDMNLGSVLLGFSNDIELVNKIYILIDDCLCDAEEKLNNSLASSLVHSNGFISKTHRFNADKPINFIQKIKNTHHDFDANTSTTTEANVSSSDNLQSIAKTLTTSINHSSSLSKSHQNLVFPWGSGVSIDLSIEMAQSQYVHSMTGPQKENSQLTRNNSIVPANVLASNNQIPTNALASTQDTEPTRQSSANQTAVKSLPNQSSLSSSDNKAISLSPDNSVLISTKNNRVSFFKQSSDELTQKDFLGQKDLFPSQKEGSKQLVLFSSRHFNNNMSAESKKLPTFKSFNNETASSERTDRNEINLSGKTGEDMNKNNKIQRALDILNKIHI